MPSSKQEVQLLLTEHFRYTPLTLIDDIINTVNTIVYRAVDAVESGLSTTPASTLGFPEALKDQNPSTATSPNTSTLSNSARDRDQHGELVYPEARAEIENGVHQLETLLESAVDNNFDRLEIYVLRNILTVPEGLERWMRLEHYRDLDLAGLKQESVTPEELLRLRRKVHETVKLQRALRAEKRRNEVLLTQLRTLLDPEQSGMAENLAFLMHSPALEELRATAHGSNQPLTVLTKQALAQLPQLRETVKQLREAQKRGISAPTRAGRDEERNAYIEGVVRTAVGGHKGQGVGVGQKVSTEEVSAIEGIAKGFAQDR